MRWALWMTVAIVVLLAVYIASPLVALHSVASAVESRDAAALVERIDFKSLRRSLTKQIVTTYLELTGKKLPLGAIGKRFAISVADPIVARLMTVTALLDLLGKGEAATAKVLTSHAPFTSRSFSRIWHLWLRSDYLGRDFYIYLPPEAPRGEQFEVHLRPKNWRWTIVEINLPEDLKRSLARELVKVTEERLSPYEAR